MSKKKFKNPNLGGQVHKRQILLSISIMVSGREETTRKCIASLDRLRSRVPCELILTDTGCSPEMHEWLRGRADRVLKFTWCNDFAAARNVGLRTARGLWFMFMDDDEWFEDTARIESFFLSGDYKRYQSASYIVRNYAEMDGSVWRDTPLMRMTRIRQETRFFYPIHESLWPLLDPIKRLEDYAHHYGYASSDPEVQMAKRRRNLQILLPEIERDSHCMKHYLQAVSEYFSIDDYEPAWEMADRGIANLDSDRDDNAPHIYGLYAAAVRMRLRAKRSAEVIQRGVDHLEHAVLSDLARASIDGDLAIAYGELGEYRESLRFLQDYLKWKDYFSVNSEEWVKQVTLILDSCFENFQYRKAMGWGFAAVLALGDVQTAESLLAKDSLQWWLDAVRGWYTLASGQEREKWQRDFQGVFSKLEQINQHRHLIQAGKQLQSGQWEEDGEPYFRIRQLYAILTVPEQRLRRGTEEGASNQEYSQVTEGNAGTAPERRKDGAEEAQALENREAEQAAKQMEVLAGQLKEKIRLLIRQGQTEAALGAIQQMKMLLPQDMELAELQARCEET